MESANAFFIAGAQRSGTTLLSVMLGKHPEIDIDGNALAFRLITCFELYGEVLPYNANRSWAELQSWLIEEDYKGRLAGFIDFEHLEKYPSARAAIQQAIEQRLGKSGKSTFGDKAPELEAFLPQLLMLVPQAKIIHMVRDGRAAAFSKANRAHRNLLHAAQEWVESITHGLQNQAMLGENRYLMLQYEDLLREPETTAKQVCAFLGLDWHPAMVAEKLSEGDTASYVKPMLDSSKIDAYQGELSTAQLQKIERLQAPYLQRFGYPLQFADSLARHRPMSELKRFRISQASNFRQLFVAKRIGMTNRKAVEVRVPLGTRIRHFGYYLAFDLLKKRLFRRIFRKRFVKNVHLPRAKAS